MYARLGKYSEGIKCVSQKRKLRNAAGCCAISLTNPNKSRYIVAPPPASDKYEPTEEEDR